MTAIACGCDSLNWSNWLDVWGLGGGSDELRFTMPFELGKPDDSDEPPLKDADPPAERRSAARGITSNFAAGSENDGLAADSDTVIGALLTNDDSNSDALNSGISNLGGLNPDDSNAEVSNAEVSKSELAVFAGSNSVATVSNGGGEHPGTNSSTSNSQQELTSKSCLLYTSPSPRD